MHVIRVYIYVVIFYMILTPHNPQTNAIYDDSSSKWQDASCMDKGVMRELPEEYSYSS